MTFIEQNLEVLAALFDGLTARKQNVDKCRTIILVLVFYKVVDLKEVGVI